MGEIELYRKSTKALRWIREVNRRQAIRTYHKAKIRDSLLLPGLATRSHRCERSSMQRELPGFFPRQRSVLPHRVLCRPSLPADGQLQIEVSLISLPGVLHVPQEIPEKLMRKLLEVPMPP